MGKAVARPCDLTRPQIGVSTGRNRIPWGGAGLGSRSSPLIDHAERVAVPTRPHTARHVRLCGAFGRRLGLSLVLLLFAALSPCLGGLLGW